MVFWGAIVMGGLGSKPIGGATISSLLEGSLRTAEGLSFPYFSLHVTLTLFPYRLASLWRSQELQTNLRLYFVLGHIPSYKLYTINSKSHTLWSHPSYPGQRQCLQVNWPHQGHFERRVPAIDYSPHAHTNCRPTALLWFFRPHCSSLWGLGCTNSRDKRRQTRKQEMLSEMWKCFVFCVFETLYARSYYSFSIFPIALRLIE